MQSVERALDVALLVMRNGGSTRMADRTFRNVLKGCHQEGVAAAWRMDLVVVSGVVGGAPATILRTVGAVGVNLVRASEAATLGERVARGEVAPAAVGAEIERISTLKPTLSRGWMIAAAACTGAAFSRLAGGDWGAPGIAFVAAGAGQAVRALGQARGIPVAPLTLACGVLSAGLAGVGVRLGVSQSAPATLIASVIYMVPGLPLINGFLDVISYRHLLAGLERIAHAMLMFLILSLAVAIARTVVS